MENLLFFTFSDKFEFFRLLLDMETISMRDFTILNGSIAMNYLKTSVQK